MIDGNYNALSFRARAKQISVSNASYNVEALSDDYYERERNSTHCLANHITIDRYLTMNESVDYETSEE